MRKFIVTLSVAALLAVAAPAGVGFASSEPMSLSEVAVMSGGPAGGGAGPAPAKAVSVSADEVMSLTLDEGQVLRLPRAATSVFVANPEIADVQVKSGALLYIYGRRVGQTSFYAVDNEDNVVASRTITVGFNLGALRRAIRQITGEETVKVGQVEDMILLTGSVDNATTAQDVVRTATRYLPKAVVDGAQGTDLVALGNNNIINRLSYTGSNQVNIRVRIAEVRREAIKTLGIKTDIANPRLFGDVDMSVGFDPSISSASGAAMGAAGLGTTWGATTLSAALNALVDDGMATILAEPNLTALSGETANFLAGGEFPLALVTSNNGISTVTVEYKEYGVRLAFTPTVVNGNRINLRVAPEVSERDDANSVVLSGGTVPGFRTRKAETSVELGSGQSFAIAGLIQNDSSQDVSKFPGLGDLPVIGQLFRSEQFRQNQTELVVIVTPYLVKPTTASALMVPTDGFIPPNDVDRYLDGRMNSVAPTPAPVATAEPASSPAEGGLSGQIGYVLQ